MLRERCPGDEGYLAKTWFEIARRSTAELRQLPPEDSMRLLAWRIDVILGRADVLVLSPPDDQDVIYGFRVSEPKKLHCVYVKSPLRRLGLGRGLLAGFELAGAVVTTPPPELWMRRRTAQCRVVPFWTDTEEG